MKNAIALRGIRAYNYYKSAEAGLRQRAARLFAERESGLQDMPWMMILLVVGALAAIGIGVWVIAFVKGHLASVPADPTY